MRNYFIILFSLLTMLSIILCADPKTVLAQDAVETTVAAETTVAVDTASHAGEIKIDFPEDWEHEAALYRGWGWGLFGTGAAMAAVGTGLLLGIDDTYSIIGLSTSFYVLSAALLIPGISVLIADAVKFNSLREAKENDGFLPYDPDWEETSFVYRAWGWGLFGAGLLSFAVGTGLILKGSENPESVETIAPILLYAVGSGALIAGSGLLIADAVKFNRYRDATTGFSWQPQLYLSPQMTGLGISGRF